MNEQFIKAAQERFGRLLEAQLARVESMRENAGMVDVTALGKIVVGVCGGDGIGPAITAQAKRCLEALLADEIAAGSVELRDITGLTLERRLLENRAIPEETLAQLKACDVILKGPTETPQAGAKVANLESANVAMRRELDLFANVRPVRVPEIGANWTFFRENTEGAYVVGSQGVNVTDDLSVDFAVTTTQGTERICRAAFEYAVKNGKKRVTCVTKANVIKTTDGKFLNIFQNMAKEYEKYGIKTDDWYIDIMTAKLLDPARRGEFEVLVMPNLYGDILTDEAAQIQGGVGTAGSANVGARYAMFEAIHGSAPRMVEEGREIYADPSSIIRAAGMLLGHSGFPDKAKRLDDALDACLKEGKFKITGRPNGCTSAEFGDYIISKLGVGR